MTGKTSVVFALALFCAGGARAEELLWSEEFDSDNALKCSVWSYDLGDGCSQGICGWGNNEFQNYTKDPENVRVEGGHLIITAQRQTVNGPGDPGPDSYTFTSARLKTKERLTLQYATVEARIQLPDLGDGLWPAFWTLGNNIDTATWPECGEIDIFEMGSAGAIAAGAVNRSVGSTAHWDDDGNTASYGLTYTSPTDLNDEFHIYRMEWTPTEITTYIDGIWIWTIDISNPAGFSGEEFHEPHFLLLNMAVGGNYTGIVGESSNITATFPAEYRVDWIRIYDNGSTVLGGIGPLELAVSRVADDAEIAFTTVNNVSYDVVYKVDLSDPEWTLLQSVVGNGEVMSVFDSITSPARFYEVVESSE
jgi:beta-glucanase (GH16 family)